jgi:hypothetical protein
MILEMLNTQSSIGCSISVILLIFSPQNEQIVILEDFRRSLDFDL